MKNIALAILSVGLCFYVSWQYQEYGDLDWVASLVAFIAAIAVFIV